jgi:hypothetical protein
VTPGATGFRVQNLRIMLNGTIPVQGQGFARMDELVTSSRQELSSTCSVIPKERGAACDPLVADSCDEFALAFEVLGNFEDLVDPDILPPGGVAVFTEPLPDNGIRDFARINESMAAVTGVPAGDVDAIYLPLTQALPGGYDLRAFASSHQVGVTNLAFEYCDRAVEDGTLRAQLAPGFDYDSDATVALDAAGRATLVQGLTQSILGQDLIVPLTTQPTTAEVMPHLLTLIEDLAPAATCTAQTCPASLTQTVAKAACTALLSSAAATIH